MWLPDFSNLFYGTSNVKNGRIGTHFNIGWLSHRHEFPTGSIDDEILNKLRAYPIVNRCRGFHPCDFCEENVFGNGEIHVISNGGVEFRSPQMLIHYIEFHSYLPPQPFLDAVIGLPVSRNDVIQYILHHHEPTLQFYEEWEKGLQTYLNKFG
jgi:hypothetical protein